MMIKAEWVIGETVTELQMARENHDHLRNIAADGLNPEEAVAYLNEQDPQFHTKFGVDQNTDHNINEKALHDIREC